MKNISTLEFIIIIAILLQFSTPIYAQWQNFVNRLKYVLSNNPSKNLPTQITISEDVVSETFLYNYSFNSDG
ncbi:MAG: hypothetical protein M9958_00220 [Chitinophagales bacterium]|nr:hypothetical protein [Chitinophagales bacterium]